MADATAILAVSNAIKSTLQAGLKLVSINENQIVIESIDLLPSPAPHPRITIFLYNLHEDPFLKNQPATFVPTAQGTGDVLPAPLTLGLDYMICAWATTTQDEHLLLGDILRVFHDQPELGPELLGPTWRADESVQITLANPSIEDQARIWTTFGFKRFKLSLYYKVRVVPIASQRGVQATAVRERRGSVGPFASAEVP